MAEIIKFRTRKELEQQKEERRLGRRLHLSHDVGDDTKNRAIAALYERRQDIDSENIASMRELLRERDRGDVNAFCDELRKVYNVDAVVHLPNAAISDKTRADFLRLLKDCLDAVNEDAKKKLHAVRKPVEISMIPPTEDESRFRFTLDHEQYFSLRRVHYPNALLVPNVLQTLLQRFL